MGSSCCRHEDDLEDLEVTPREEKLVEVNPFSEPKRQASGEKPRVRIEEARTAIKDAVKASGTVNSLPEKRVQAMGEINYGPPGTVPKGATGTVLSTRAATHANTSHVLVDWDAFPQLGRVSVQCFQVAQMNPDIPGRYSIVRPAGVTTSREPSEDVVGILAAGKVVDVLEVVHCKEAMRWRGRIEEPFCGWISLLATYNGIRWAEPQALGRGLPAQGALQQNEATPPIMLHAAALGNTGVCTAACMPPAAVPQHIGQEGWRYGSSSCRLVQLTEGVPAGDLQLFLGTQLEPQQVLRETSSPRTTQQQVHAVISNQDHGARRETLGGSFLAVPTPCLTPVPPGSQGALSDTSEATRPPSYVVESAATAGNQGRTLPRARILKQGELLTASVVQAPELVPATKAQGAQATSAAEVFDVLRGIREQVKDMASKCSVPADSAAHAGIASVRESGRFEYASMKLVDQQ